MIKRLAYIIIGACFGALISYGAAWVIGELFGPLHSSEDDMVRNIKIYLAVTAAFMIIGGFVGNRLYNPSK